MIKLFLLSGFLGAGKTTFLKSAMEQLSDHKIGIIMNEFGRVSIDYAWKTEIGTEMKMSN